jgi:putative redox protein
MKPSLTTQISQVDHLKFAGTTGSGQKIVAEPGQILGGSGTYPNPMEYFVASIGTCAAIKLQLDLDHRDHHAESITIRIDGTRSPVPPEILETIHLTFILTGRLDPQQVAGAIEDTLKLNCPIAVMAGRIAELTWDYQIREPGTG